MKKIFILVCLTIATNAFASGGGSSVGPANPAALNCIKLGGTTESHENAEGTYSNCVIDEWSLYSAMAERHLLVEHHYNGWVPNPAAVNCLDVGGEFRAVETPGGTAGMCVVDEWKLFDIINILY